MNQEQIAKLKELAEKAIEKAPWPFYLAALNREATPEVILELIALAERALLAAAPSPAVAVEPDAYQYRAKLGNGDWSEWRPATKLIVDTCSNHELYEVRGLYATPSPSLAVREKPNADCSGEPANCPDNEGYGCACDPMNKAAMREQP